VNQNTFIPKTAHISWVDQSIFEHDSPIAKHGVQALVSLNPDWNVVFYTEDQVNAYIKDELGRHVFRLLEPTHIVERLDIWRLIKLYNEGGMYVDIDRLHNRALTPLLPGTARCILPMNGDRDFSQDLMISAPGNPLYLTAMELSLQRRREGHTSTYFLGPQTYMHAVSQLVLNRIVDSNPGIEEIVELRKAIYSVNFLATYRESFPKDTFLFRCEEGQELAFDHEAEKRKLYASYDLKHWTNDW
jgi:mannosyltransferase OCH1-like enzyme